MLVVVKHKELHLGCEPQLPEKLPKSQVSRRRRERLEEEVGSCLQASFLFNNNRWNLYVLPAFLILHARITPEEICSMLFAEYDNGHLSLPA